MDRFLNKIICGDNVDIMKQMPDNCINLTVTSPPYDDLRKYNGYNFDFPTTAQELFRVTKHGGVVVWVVNDKTVNGSETLTSFKQALYFKDIGFNLHDTMIYAKSSYMPLTHNRYEQQFEYMFILVKHKLETWNPIMVECLTYGTKRNRRSSKANETTYAERKREGKTIVNRLKQHGNIFYYNVGKNDKTAHNAPFPEQLAHDHIISWSNEGDIVFDPMCGSGTTCKMAKLLKRNYVGIDCSHEYVDISNNRLNELTG